MHRSTILAGAALAAAALATALLTTSDAGAQEWPSKPVRVVSPFAAGGSSDTVARIIADDLGTRLHEQFFVENRGGAGGLIGSAAVANASPDGYTFLISSIGTHVIAPLTNANAGYDPITSFTHVGYLGGPPTVVVVHPSLGVRSFKALLALLKHRSEALPYVSPGPGTIGNLMAEYWAEREAVKLAHIAYKGSGQAMNDLVAGHVKLGSLTWTAALGQMRGGTVIPLAVSSARRMPGFPDVPTMKELGYPDLVVTTWFGVAAPAGLPSAITMRMNLAINNALDTASVRDRLAGQGFELETMTPPELTDYIRTELTKWGPLAKKVMATGPTK